MTSTERRRPSPTSTDLTVGVEEEFSILDPQTLELAPRFEELRAAAEGDRLLHEAITGELISSEIEIISGAGADLHDALARQRERRRRLFALAGAHGAALGATGTHPWADYREQPIIDTEHYRRVEEGLKYVAWRNNTFSLHVHVGVRDIDRAVRVCDRLRPRAAAAARDLGQLAVPGRSRQRACTRRARRASRRASRAAGSPTRSAAGRPTASTSSSSCGRARSSSSPRSGGRSGRTSASARSRCGSATRRRPPQESDALAALMVACIGAGAARRRRGRARSTDPPPRMIEENMWRAIRFGLDGSLIDLERAEEYPAARGDRAPGRVDRAGPRRARHRAGLPRAQRRAAPAAHDRRRAPAREEVFAASVKETRQTYSEEVTV